MYGRSAVGIRSLRSRTFTDIDERATMTGAELIAAERQRQIDAEGYTPEHDSVYVHGELWSAAVCYGTSPEHRNYLDWQHTMPRGWPWAYSEWKPVPGCRVRELVKAGALIAAEIDRLQADKAEIDRLQVHP